jgi:hypothetical protein
MLTKRITFKTVHSKDIIYCRKTVQENADDDILTKQYFLRAHTEERRELETGLIVVRTNIGQC